MRPINAQELKDKINKDMVLQLMDYFGAQPLKENEEYIIFPTICHSSQSPKLYYYPSTNSWNCWSQCGGQVDIISIVQEQEGLTFQESIEWLIDFFQLNTKKWGRPKIEHKPREIQKKEIDINEKLPCYNESILNTFYSIPIADWLNEGISKDTMDLFGIKFDLNTNGIIIPHRDLEGRLVGIRVRNLNKKIIEEYGKYLPWRDTLSGILYKHPIGRNLYGMDINKDNIIKHQKVILLESEKSVLKVQEFYPNNNISLALCGSNATDFQLQLLKSIGVRQVIFALDKEEDEKWLKKVDKIYRKTALLFDTYIVQDKEGLLDLKDSPTDKGKEVFNRLLINKKEYKIDIN